MWTVLRNDQEKVLPNIIILCSSGFVEARRQFSSTMQTFKVIALYSAIFQTTFHFHLHIFTHSFLLVPSYILKTGSHSGNATMKLK